MKKFKPGKLYSNRENNDEFTFVFEVLSRTSNTIKIRNRFGKTKTCKIDKSSSSYRNAETIFPFGNFSNALAISAD